jgi:predicted kinase
MRSPTVYLLCGFIGAGKTTFAMKLEARTGAVRITKDEWLVTLIGHDPTIDGYADYDQRVVNLSREVAFRFVEKGIDVILDEGFWSRKERTEMRGTIEAMGARPVLIYLDTPIDSIRKRVERRDANPPRDSLRIGDALLDYYLTFWEPPGNDEEYVLANALEDRDIPDRDPTH